MSASRLAARPRICMTTGRNFTKRAFQCGHYEAQDVLQEVEDIDLIRLDPGCGFRFKESWLRRLLYHDVSRKLIFANPGLRRVRLTREYELFVALCQTYWEFLYVNAVEGWKDYCKTTVCWIDEMWAAEVPLYKYWLHALKRFDHVFVGYHSTVAPLSNAIDRTCHWLPGAVDAIRFSPYPDPPERVIDVYSIGRRWEHVHQALLQAAGRRGLFYVYDTFPAAESEVYDHRQHRELYASMAKRSRAFVVAPGKMNIPEETQGQVEIGYRYYEGAAAGAVMIGQPPDCEAFSKMFPWPDVVVKIQPDGSDVLEALAGLRAEPERATAIGRRNAAGALLHHDWVYRWKEILRVADMEPSPGMVGRESRLKNLADLAACGC